MKRMISTSLVIVICIIGFVGLTNAGSEKLQPNEIQMTDETGAMTGIGYTDNTITKAVRFREGITLSQEEEDAFRKTFFRIMRELPNESYLSVSCFPTVPRCHARLSDGKVYVAVGVASTLSKALESIEVTASQGGEKKQSGI